MNPEQWTRLSELFGELVEIPEAERRVRLDDPGLADGLGPELHLELHRMLAAHANGRPLALEERVAHDPDPAPERIGPYRLERLLGEGGMGEVWLAERDEPGFRRRVALKRIRRGLESGELRRRFGIEREALARLSHRGIAQLLDGGIDSAGIPYLALEYVDGRPLVEAADLRRLALDERLALFEEVCDAVHYAHVHLVVHRDLKPSNILMTESGEVRLLDFGIAKLLDPESADVAPAGGEAIGATRTSLRLATPEYASPEQLAGETVTTATDVYALGLLLFELLTGRRPFRDHEGSLTELERAVRSVDPRRPSETVAGTRDVEAASARRSNPSALARALRGDLDTIVATALRKSPERRYPSVERLAEDVARFRAGRPIRARPESATYRLRKFAGRHRVGVGAAAVIALLLTAFTAFAVRQSTLVASERDAARAERDKARELSTFLIDLFGADPFAGDQELRDTTTLGEFLERSEAAVRRELADRPDLRAALLSRLARLHGNLGRLDRARALAEEALTDRRALPGDRRADVAESVNNLAIVLVEREDPAQAGETERLERRGLALRRELFGEDHLDTLQSRNNFAVFLIKRGRPDDLAEAEGHLRDVLEGRRRRLGNDHPTVANTENNLANLLDDLGRETEAIAHFREAIRAWTVTLGPEHPRVATGLYGLYAALADSGDLAGAEQALRASLAIDERRLPPGHPYLATDRLKLGELLLAAGRPAEAEAELRWALAAFRKSGEEGGKEAALAQGALDDYLARLGRQDPARVARVAGTRR